MGKNLSTLLFSLLIFLYTSCYATSDWRIAVLQLREEKLSQMDGSVWLKDPLRGFNIGRNLDLDGASEFPWRKNIMTTIFWIGEKATKGNPVSNDKSSWDTRWKENYGGYDCPRNRIGFRPIGFIPRQNPFYVALPYNDIGKNGTKPEAPKVIPWFHERFERNGKSVIKGQWVAIRYKGRVAYAQWEDVGPFRTDHWQYVFGDQKPGPNRNNNAGLDISPAVRDYLGMKGNDYTDWRFVRLEEVPYGPWSKYGENNPFSPYYTGNQKNQIASYTNSKE